MIDKHSAKIMMEGHTLGPITVDRNGGVWFHGRVQGPYSDLVLRIHHKQQCITVLVGRVGADSRIAIRSVECRLERPRCTAKCESNLVDLVISRAIVKS